MLFVEILFWFCLGLVWYTYIGYGMLLYLIIKLKRIFRGPQAIPEEPTIWPHICLMVAAYNEEDWIADKLDNHLNLDYPVDRIQHAVVTDGSNDGTAEIVRQYAEKHPNLELYHKDGRAGKIAAVQRVMDLIEEPIVIFTDANTLLNPDCLKKIVRHYRDPRVGAVAGEKRILVEAEDGAQAAGEGFYWKYESALKRWDSELYSVVGAAGELFSIRKSVYRHVPKDSIIEDFHMTLSVAADGHLVRYEPEAFAAEGPSDSVGEELKRKIRIAAGGLQSVWRLRSLMNPFRYGILSFQFISHRVLRWTVTPLALVLVFVLNSLLLFDQSIIYKLLFAGQLGFYLLALTGMLLERRKIKMKAFFVPYYFAVMNYAVFAGFVRTAKGSQSVMWEKAKRRA